VLYVWSSHGVTPATKQILCESKRKQNQKKGTTALIRHFPNLTDAQNFLTMLIAKL
jgi:hypothetical protein